MSDSERPKERMSFLRGLAMGVGLLIMTGSGLCSAGFLVTMLADALTSTSRNSLGDVATVVGTVFMVGGLPFLLGWTLWRMARTGKGRQ